MIFKNLFGGKSRYQNERSVYNVIVAAARQVWFYEEAGVPDTVLGRFDVICVHMVIVLEHLQQGDDAAKKFAQELVEEMFRDFDRSIRELGVGDLSVGKRMRKLANMFYGRAESYKAAFADDDVQKRHAKVADVITRNFLTDSAYDEITGAALSKSGGEKALDADKISTSLLAWRTEVAALAREDIINGQLHLAENEDAKS